MSLPPTAPPASPPPSALLSPAAGERTCRATDRLAFGGVRVGFLYRDTPAHPADSGWRFLAGDESDEDLDDPAHTGSYALSDLAILDPDVVPLLDEPVGSAFRRDPVGERFVPVAISPW